jgi:hypothetical protein
MLPWLGQPIVAPPYTINSNSPPSMGSNSNLPSPRISEWGPYEENVAAQGSGLFFVPSPDVLAQCPGAHPNHFNTISEWGPYQENVAAAAQESGLLFVSSSYPTSDVPAQCPSAHPNHFNSRWCNSNLNKVAYHPNLCNYTHAPVAQDNAFTNPNMVPPVAQHVKRTK